VREVADPETVVTARRPRARLLGQEGPVVVQPRDREPTEAEDMHTDIQWRRGLLVLATVGVVACTGAEPEVLALASDVGSPTNDPTITVSDNEFGPDELVVEAGTEVTWEWQGEAEHDVVGANFESPRQASGTFTHTFEEPGTYTFVCSPHAGMTGTVHVVP
jgi:plastocyanin